MQSAENEGEASARLSLSAIVLVACGFCPSATWKTKFGDNLTRLPRGVKVGDTVTHPLATWNYRFGDNLTPLATWNNDEDAANDRSTISNNNEGTSRLDLHLMLRRRRANEIRYLVPQTNNYVNNSMIHSLFGR